jgi:hypothetical protein
MCWVSRGALFRVVLVVLVVLVADSRPPSCAAPPPPPPDTAAATATAGGHSTQCGLYVLCRRKGRTGCVAAAVITAPAAPKLKTNG